jgi:hypothetical protein
LYKRHLLSTQARTERGHREPRRTDHQQEQRKACTDTGQLATTGQTQVADGAILTSGCRVLIGGGKVTDVKTTEQQEKKQDFLTTGHGDLTGKKVTIHPAEPEAAMERVSVARMATAKLQGWIQAARGMGVLRLCPYGAK